MEKKNKAVQGDMEYRGGGDHSSSVVGEGLPEKGHLNMSLNQEGRRMGLRGE